MKFAIIFEDQPGAGMELRMKHMEAHLEFLERNEVVITSAGPLRENDGSLAGGLWIVEAEDNDKANRLVQEDPFWSIGLRKTVRILAWQQVFANGQRLISV